MYPSGSDAYWPIGRVKAIYSRRGHYVRGHFVRSLVPSHHCQEADQWPALGTMFVGRITSWINSCWCCEHPRCRRIPICPRKLYHIVSRRSSVSLYWELRAIAILAGDETPLQRSAANLWSPDWHDLVFTGERDQQAGKSLELSIPGVGKLMRGDRTRCLNVFPRSDIVFAWFSTVIPSCGHLIKWYYLIVAISNYELLRYRYRWYWSLFLRILSFFSALTLLIGSFDQQKLIPDMTYNVFGATSNLTQLQLPWRLSDRKCPRRNESTEESVRFTCICHVSAYSDNLQPIATRGKKARCTLLVDQHCGNCCSINRAPLSHWATAKPMWAKQREFTALFRAPVTL